jgi:hypothetical protein
MERPILFSGAMVRQILSGAKTATRRIVRIDDSPITASKAGHMQRGLPSSPVNLRWCGPYVKCDAPPGSATVSSRVRCPYGVPYDRLWVKEAHQAIWETGECPATSFREGGPGWKVHYVADGGPVEWHDMSRDDEGLSTRSRPSIFMPRWASRLTLEVVEVRIERLQDITEDDIRREGVTIELAAELSGITWSSLPTLRDAWSAGWDAINGSRATWASNCWVWVIGFRVAKGGA